MSKDVRGFVVFLNIVLLKFFLIIGGKYLQLA
ncbi:hypothetical protein CHY_1612 [Carboxydothermus hydrogenoformans Z-2901]|uniref:Uncharacterized protein n=1 Tax=Carboxydothermus hydrogenoformans (strain ATCC BAA-161 / DSM 6008 / Z-2901) TaxID=246194 RepID=Q3ABP4_CARHZ|nr:hypothetical protein CHY_1612 [Carboxydothermus hydrogenoformans Z-2901]